MLNNHTLPLNNYTHTLQAWMSDVIDDPYRSEVDLIIHSDYPCGHYDPVIRGKQTAMIRVPYGTPGLDKLMNHTYIYGEQKLALKGKLTVNNAGFPFFVTESVRPLEDDESVIATMWVEHLRMPFVEMEHKIVWKVKK